MRTAALFASGAVLAALLNPGTAEASPTAETAEHAASITKAQARKIVSAGVVKKTDVRGFTAEKNVADPADDATEKALYTCLGGKPPKEVLVKDGPTLSKGPQTIDSSAAVIATLRQAKADVKLARSKKAPRCLKKAFIASAEADGVVVHSVRVKAIPVSVRDADVAFGYSYEIIASFEGNLVAIHGYDLNALVGQTELNVSIARYAGPPPNLKQGVSLLTKTVKRVDAVS